MEIWRVQQDSNITCSVQVDDIFTKYLATFSSPDEMYPVHFSAPFATLRVQQDSNLQDRFWKPTVYH